jgi:hypothetical protein
MRILTTAAIAGRITRAPAMSKGAFGLVIRRVVSFFGFDSYVPFLVQTI